MRTVTASPTRTGPYTQVLRCRNCQRAIWLDPSWNAVYVLCPHCKTKH